MKAKDPAGAVLLTILCAFWFMAGYAMRSREARAQIVTAEQLGVEPAINDAAYSGDYRGVLALGVAGSVDSNYPRVGSDGDTAVLRIDRATGRVLAKCEVTP